MLTLVVVPVAYLLLARTLERVKAMARFRCARAAHEYVTGVIVLIAVLGWLISATSAFAQSPNPPLTLTFNQALERAMANSEGLKVAKERKSSRRRRACRSRRPSFLPPSELGLQLHAVAKIPGHRIPAGVWTRGANVSGRLLAA